MTADGVVEESRSEAEEKFISTRRLVLFLSAAGEGFF
jgi:hypothetical protein